MSEKWVKNILIFVGLTIFLWIITPSEEKEDEPTMRRRKAYYLAQEIVKERLPNPWSTEFSGFNPKNIMSFKRISNTQYQVVTWVKTIVDDSEVMVCFNAGFHVDEEITRVESIVVFEWIECGGYMLDNP